MSATPPGSLLAFRDFLNDVRMRASNELTTAYCRDDDVEADPADVHEDFREALFPYFEEIRLRIEGPACSERIEIGLNAYSMCSLPAGHEGECAPW